MKILLVVTGLSIGGAERLVTSLADNFSSAGHDVILVYFHGEAEIFPQNPHVKIVDIGMRRSPLGVLAGMWRLRRLIRNFKPDVVNSHLVHANIITRLIRLTVSIPRLISSAHNTNEGGRFRMFAYRLTDVLADISTNVSDEAVAAFEKKGAILPGRMQTILNGIDTNVFSFDTVARGKIRNELDVDSVTPLILSVGRLCEQKDYPNLLRSFAHLDIGTPAPKLAIIGQGSLRGQLEALVDSLGIKDRVKFLGIRHDVPDVLSACDVFVLSSAWEGFGLVVAEAMACERLVVATDCGGVKEVVGSAGILVPPKDSEALSAGLTNALGLTPEKIERFSISGRDRVIKKFSIDAMAQHYLKLYRCLD
ncbi:glycosyltransferase [Onishia taeanensis]